MVSLIWLWFAGCGRKVSISFDVFIQAQLTRIELKRFWKWTQGSELGENELLFGPELAEKWRPELEVPCCIYAFFSSVLQFHGKRLLAMGSCDCRLRFDNSNIGWVVKIGKNLTVKNQPMFTEENVGFSINPKWEERERKSERLSVDFKIKIRI